MVPGVCGTLLLDLYELPARCCLACKVLLMNLKLLNGKVLIHMKDFFLGAFNEGIQAGNSFKYQKVDRRQNVT